MATNDKALEDFCCHMLWDAAVATALEGYYCQGVGVLVSRWRWDLSMILATGHHYCYGVFAALLWVLYDYYSYGVLPLLPLWPSVL